MSYTEVEHRVYRIINDSLETVEVQIDPAIIAGMAKEIIRELQGELH